VKGIKRVWENTGAAEAARAVGARLVSFEAEGSVPRPVKSRFLDEIRITRFCDETNVISVAKLKTHFLTIMTGAVKNCLGFIPGLAKADLHRRAPHPDDFAELVVDLLPALAPRFTFVDGVVGLEGDGPASGRPRNFGLVVGGYNAAAVDVLLAYVLGFEADDVKTVKLGIERGLTPAAPEIVTLDGTYTDLVFDDVAVPGSLWLRRLPRPLLRFASRQFVIKPAVRAENCTGCRRCVESCPVGAARMDGKVAEIKSSECIECLCCYETCADGAVYLKPSRAARLYYALRDFRRRRRRRPGA
jgi:NAD-dependent dihydropyrimidine dehydrogenase PreA subunit